MSEVRSQRLRVLFLAAAHLRHEWVLTLCLVSALAAVLAPLLILLGLKEGTVETLRDRLVQDPVYREIRPAITRTFDQQWLDRLHNEQGVAFLIPTILPASSMIHLRSGTASGELVDLVPTAGGDPLLLENSGVIPLEGECVLSSEAARRLGVSSGDQVTARVTRSRGGRMENVDQLLQVVAVLDTRAGTLPRIYAPLDFVVDVESYKEGREVAARGWRGESAYPYMSFDGVVVVSQIPLDPVTRTGLVVNTGLLKAVSMESQDFTAVTGLNLTQGWFAYDLSIPSGSVTMSSVVALKRKLRGRDALLLPYAEGITLTLGEEKVRARGLSISSVWAERLGWPVPPWGELSTTALSPSRLFQLLWPAADVVEKSVVRADFEGIRPLNFPLRVSGVYQPGIALLPAELIGMLRTARDRVVGYNPDSSGLLLERAGFRGFRLYGRSIDDIPLLVERFRSDGLEVVAEVDAIERIQVLDRGLTQLFWLIAILGVVGAGAVLVASLYAAVERERKDLGILRLIGLARTDVFLFPVFQGVLIAILGVMLGWLGYTLLAGVINHTFDGELSDGQAICRLPASYPWLALLASLGLAIASSLIAAWKATRIEPAEAIREE
ncbi:MAG: FtsX-like permease family protein [Sedimenticola sp.]|nr:FtsX-like permease family protein [Sedimenticola sp.]